MNAQEIAARLKVGNQVTDAEKAFLLHNDIHALSAFMIDNNPGSVNMTLRQMGYDHLGFTPNPKALAQQIGMLIERKDVPALNTIVQNFEMTDKNVTPGFLRAWAAYRG